MKARARVVRAMKRGLSSAFARWTPREPRVLVYHSVDDSGSVLSVSPAQLRHHLRHLKALGFRSVRLSELRQEGRVAEGRGAAAPIAITFDDGYENIYTQAWPIFRELGFSATVFVVTDYVAHRATWIARDEGRILSSLFPGLRLDERERDRERTRLQQMSRMPLLSWDQIAEMASTGFEFQSHSASHPFLSAQQPDTVAGELARSKSVLEKRLGAPVNWFCYPYGDLGGSDVARTLEELGYEGAMASGWGLDAFDRPTRYAAERFSLGPSSDEADLDFCLSRAFDVAGNLRRTIQQRKRSKTMDRS